MIQSWSTFADCEGYQPCFEYIGGMLWKHRQAVVDIPSRKKKIITLSKCFILYTPHMKEWSFPQSSGVRKIFGCTTGLPDQKSYNTALKHSMWFDSILVIEQTSNHEANFVGLK